MSKELDQAMFHLRRFVQKADAAFPGLPEITLTFPTENAMQRFRAQLRTDAQPFDGIRFAALPNGVDAEYNGIRIRTKVRT